MHPGEEITVTYCTGYWNTHNAAREKEEENKN